LRGQSRQCFSRSAPRSDCRDQFRIGVVIIEARDEVRIGKRLWRIEREALT